MRVDIGTSGIPIELAQSRDYDAIFSELAAAGMTVFSPCSTYQEYPQQRGLGYEADFFPPPYGSATTEIYDLARQYGIKIAFSAEYMFPLDKGGVDGGNSPLQAIIDAGGRDIIHSVLGYDEAAWNGIDPAASRAVYEHVKAVDPSIEVVQVHAPVTENDPSLYLDQVLQHAAWADVVGFNVYPIREGITGSRTPLRPDEIVEPGAALRDYVSWLEAELGDKGHVMVLQGFEQNDLYSDDMLAAMSLGQLALSRPPTLLEMREMMIAVQDVDLVYWWGAGLRHAGDDPVWKTILDVADRASNGALGTPLGALTDANAAANELDEDAAAGSATGIRLQALDADDLDSVSYALDDDRFVVGARGHVTIAAGATFDFETEPVITIGASARSTDGSFRSARFVIAVGDVIDQLNGTDGGDVIVGGSGDDHIRARLGQDVVDGLAGHDRILGGGGRDELHGGQGRDTLRGGDDADILQGGEGRDKLGGGAGSDHLHGGGHNDRIDAGGDADMVFGGAGHDSLFGRGGDDGLRGDGGGDALSGGKGHDTLHGGAGRDILQGGAGRDELVGGTGADTLRGGDEADHVEGGDGNDRMFGGAGDDILLGGAGDDVIVAGAGDDFILGGDGGDTIRAVGGVNTVHGGAGDDSITAGTGADTFVFRGETGHDRIDDFDVEADVLAIEGATRLADLVITTTGADAVIDHAGGRITLYGVDAGDLDHANLTFL